MRLWTTREEEQAWEDDAFRVRGILDTDLDKSQRFGVPLQGWGGGSQEEDCSDAVMFTRFVFFNFSLSLFQTRRSGYGASHTGELRDQEENPG